MRPKDLGMLSIPLIGGGFKQIEMNSIQYLQSDDTITNIFYNENSKIVSSKNIGLFIVELTDTQIIRVHKSYMVNLAKITEYNKVNRCVVLESKAEIPVSRELKGRVTDYLNFDGNKEAPIVGKLIIQSGDADTPIFYLKQRDYTVGRKSISKPCDIMVATEDKTMSRNHFKILIGKNGNEIQFKVFVLHPQNKTSVNGTEINEGEERMLYNKSLIKAGETDILFQSSIQDVNDPEGTIRG